ncbi:hypothetical protein [Streptomyces mirabilis]|uniref:hypothetical protein n=1 Tax=Streptomyces mirabilis TaxID=68239 RepID=UPI0036DA7F61
MGEGAPASDVADRPQPFTGPHLSVRVHGSRRRIEPHRVDRQCGQVQMAPGGEQQPLGTLMNRLPESERSDMWLTYGEQKHHVHLSHAFTTLGDTRRARKSQQRALELSAPTSTMTRTLLNIDGAACAHHDGDSEQACRRTVAALTPLPDRYRTGLVRRRALDL